MAITWKFGYTNDSVVEAGLPMDHINIQPVNQYALKVDEPDECQLSNVTTPIDQPEVLTYQASTVKNIPTKIKVSNPLPTTDGIMYGVRLDEVLRGTSSTDDSFVTDLPIVVNLSVKHPVNSAITAPVIKEVIARLVSALYTTGNEDRITDLMRSALKPTEN